MDNIKIIEVTNMDGSVTEHVIIDRGNNEYTSMPKSVYDAQQESRI
jgi:predicted aspartyl protease